MVHVGSCILLLSIANHYEYSNAGWDLHTRRCTQQTVLGCIYKLVVPWPVHLIKAVQWEITNDAVDTNV